MKLENQVVSLELAKKLKELGVKQESYFVWTTHSTNPIEQNDTRIRINYDLVASAFTVAELINLCGIELYWIRNNAHTWEVSGYKEGFTKAPTLVEALALFVIQKYETNKSI